MWRYHARLFLYSPLLYATTSILSVVFWSMLLIHGLILREFFDTLGREGHLGFSIWVIVFVFIFTSLLTQLLQLLFVRFYHYLPGLLSAVIQRNLFKTILTGPLIRGGTSSGDKVNRFRDDVDGVIVPVVMSSELLGYMVSITIALVVMIRISLAMSIVVLLPLVLVVAGEGAWNTGSGLSP